jgi:hypothetical protein
METNEDGAVHAAIGDGLRILVWETGDYVRAQVYRFVGARGPADKGAVLYDRRSPLGTRDQAVADAVAYGATCEGGVSS